MVLQFFVVKEGDLGLLLQTELKLATNGPVIGILVRQLAHHNVAFAIGRMCVTGWFFVVLILAIGLFLAKTFWLLHLIADLVGIFVRLLSIGVLPRALRPMLVPPSSVVSRVNPPRVALIVYAPSGL
jgi:hypothetical protein